MKHIGLCTAHPEYRRELHGTTEHLPKGRIASREMRTSDLVYAIPPDNRFWTTRVATCYEVWGRAYGVDHEFRVGFVARLKFNEKIGESSWWGLTERQARLDGDFWELDAQHMERAVEEVTNLMAAEARLHDDPFWKRYAGGEYSFAKRIEHYYEYLHYDGNKARYQGDRRVAADTDRARFLNALSFLPTLFAEEHGHVAHPETLAGFEREMEDLDVLGRSLENILKGVETRREQIRPVLAELTAAKRKEEEAAQRRWQEERAKVEAERQAEAQRKIERAIALTGEPPDPGSLTPERLRELVWELPITKLAAQFAISDVMVKKRCKRWGIPTPPQGFFIASPDKQAQMRRKAESP